MLGTFTQTRRRVCVMDSLHAIIVPLLEYGGDMSVRNCHDMTPLMIAAAYNNTSTAASCTVRCTPNGTAGWIRTVANYLLVLDII